MTLSDQVRDLFSENYVHPARANGQGRVQVAVSDIKLQFGWTKPVSTDLRRIDPPTFHDPSAFN